jgi:methyl-accepting chemotaxis protein
VADSTNGVNEIARSTAELVIGTQEIAMNSERASNNISEISRATKEMVAGVTEVSKNIQLINGEAGDIQEVADETKKSSEEMLETANGLDNIMSKFKVN